MACGCKKKANNGVEALSSLALLEGSSFMAEVFNSVPAGLKASVALPKTYFIRASDARKYNSGNRYLKISTLNQPIPEPIRDWLLADFRHKNDFAETVYVAAEVPVVETESVTLFPVGNTVETEAEIVEVDLDNDTLYIQAYDAAMFYEHIDQTDFTEMNLAELQLYVTHYSIDIGRATSENTIREKVTEWYLNANVS